MKREKVGQKTIVQGTIRKENKSKILFADAYDIKFNTTFKTTYI
jgi:hypothetical protein